MSWTTATFLPLYLPAMYLAGDVALVVVVAAGAEHVPETTLVMVGLVADGVIMKMPFSAYTSEAGIVTPELKWPTTNLTPSPTNLLATDTPCLGSDTSSPTSSSIFWPLMPPLALISSTACSAPFLSCAPNAAFGPVIGPATPILI